MSRDEEYYANFGAQTVDEYVEMDILNSPTEMQRFAATLAIIPKDTVTLLDVGCGPGVFLHLLRDTLGIEGIGIEITEAKVEYARRALVVDVHHGQASQLPFPDRSFDTITALEVVEHLPFGTYEKALSELERVAKTWIIVTVPYREERAFTQCPYCATRFNSSYHLRSFDEEKLNNLFRNFEVVAFYKHGEYTQFYNPFRAITSRLFPPTFPRYAVCPACGFRLAERQKEMQSPVHKSSKFKRVLHRSFTLIPKHKKNRWIIAVYKRKN